MIDELLGFERYYKTTYFLVTTGIALVLAFIACKKMNEWDRKTLERHYGKGISFINLKGKE